MSVRKYIYSPCDNAENRKLYNTWMKMIQRCTDSACERYKDYGGRGISVCNEWLDNFDAFAEWALSNGHGMDLTIDRIDNDGNYEPSNCRWVTKKEQNRNKRTNMMVTYCGETKPLVDWCEDLGLRYDPIHNRITKGWDVETAFTTPLASEYESFASMCRRHGINQTTARDRIIKFGWTLEEALNTPSQGMGGHRKPNLGYTDCRVCGKHFKKVHARQVYCCEKCHRDSKHAWFKKREGIA